MDKAMMTVPEYAAYSGLSTQTVRVLCSMDDCPAASRIGRRWIIHRDRMTEWILSRRPRKLDKVR